MVVDDRTCFDCFAEFVRLDIPATTFTSKGYCESAFKYVTKCTRDFVLRIDDDETPSDALWEFAANPPTPARFGIPVMPMLDGKVWEPVGLQERLFWRDGWRWVGGFKGHSESPVPNLIIENNPGIVIWHHLLDAPRSEREEKAARYAAIDPDTDHRSRLIYEVTHAPHQDHQFSDHPPASTGSAGDSHGLRRRRRGYGPHQRRS